jgi:hypothetical protein
MPLLQSRLRTSREERPHFATGRTAPDGLVSPRAKRIRGAKRAVLLLRHVHWANPRFFAELWAVPLLRSRRLLVQRNQADATPTHPR